MIKNIKEVMLIINLKLRDIMKIEVIRAIREEVMPQARIQIETQYKMMIWTIKPMTKDKVYFTFKTNTMMKRAFKGKA